MQAQPKAMPVRPVTCLPPKSMPLQLFTIGWKTCGARWQYNFGKLIDKGINCVSERAAFTCKAMRGGTLTWFDARNFHNPDHGPDLSSHCGEHFRIMVELTGSKEFPVFLLQLREWMADIEIANSPSMQAKRNRGAFVCTSGTHRSVACARIAYECLNRGGFNAEQPRHLSIGTWQQRNRCSTCNQCDLTNPAKIQFFDWCYWRLMSIEYD